jgi:hypothetical protein
LHLNAGKANHNLKLEDMKKMMHGHLSLITAGVVARHTKDYAGHIADYDKVQNEIPGIFNMFFYEVVKQFPNEFK